MLTHSEIDLPDMEGPRPCAVIVGVRLPDVDEAAFASSLKELARLADTLGLRVVGQVTQRRRSLAPSAVVGAGKLRELARYTDGTGVVPAYTAPGKQDREVDDDDGGTADYFETQFTGDEGADDEGADDEGADDEGAEVEHPSATPTHETANTVLVDHDLSPSQMRNLERATGVEVLDRSMVILAIFKRHARTREARIQVEIATLSYTAPRLREAHAGQDRQRGGVGGRGAGESAMELDRRRIRDRVAELKRELDVIKRDADTRRSRRVQADSQAVALVGYTNAGKSSLMRGLTGDAVVVADQLFATLDTTVRALRPETRPRILVSDTVGFIKSLPHGLVASFRSTLDEAKDAGLLLHVVDGSDPALREQIQVTREVLASIGAGEAPCLMVLNKSDRVSPAERTALQDEFSDALLMSAKVPEDLQRLHTRIVAFFEQDMLEEELLIPYVQQRCAAMLHARCRVLDERFEAAGTVMRVRAPSAVLGSIKRELAGR